MLYKNIWVLVLSFCGSFLFTNCENGSDKIEAPFTRTSLHSSCDAPTDFIIHFLKKGKSTSDEDIPWQEVIKEDGASVEIAFSQVTRDGKSVQYFGKEALAQLPVGRGEEVNSKVKLQNKSGAIEMSLMAAQGEARICVTEAERERIKRWIREEGNQRLWTKDNCFEKCTHREGAYFYEDSGLAIHMIASVCVSDISYDKLMKLVNMHESVEE